MHQAVHLDQDNLPESIKLYAISFQTDLSLNIKASNRYSQDFQEEKFIDPQSRKEMIIRKLDIIEQKQELMLKNVKEVNEFNSASDNFTQTAKVYKDEIENIIKVINSKSKKNSSPFSFEQAEFYYNALNKKEKELETMGHLLTDYKISYDVHKKIDNMYLAIEKVIDEVLNSNFEILPTNKELLNPEMINNLKQNFSRNETNVVKSNTINNKANNNNNNFVNNNDNSNNHQEIKKDEVKNKFKAIFSAMLNKEPAKINEENLIKEKNIIIDDSKQESVKENTLTSNIMNKNTNRISIAAINYSIKNVIIEDKQEGENFKIKPMKDATNPISENELFGSEEEKLKEDNHIMKETKDQELKHKSSKNIIELNDIESIKDIEEDKVKETLIIKDKKSGSIKEDLNKDKSNNSDSNKNNEEIKSNKQSLKSIKSNLESELIVETNNIVINKQETFKTETDLKVIENKEEEEEYNKSRESFKNYTKTNDDKSDKDNIKKDKTSLTYNEKLTNKELKLEKLESSRLNSKSLLLDNKLIAGKNTTIKEFDDEDILEI